MRNISHFQPTRLLDEGVTSVAVFAGTLVAIVGFVALCCNYLPWS